MSVPAFKIIAQEPISKEECEKEMSKKRSLPTREEIGEEYNKKPNDEIAQIQKAYEKGYISYDSDSFQDLDSKQLVKLFKMIVANPGYRIGLAFGHAKWEHIAIPNNLLD